MLTEETHFLFNMKKIAYFTEILHGPNSEHEHIQVNLELFIILTCKIEDFIDCHLISERHIMIPAVYCLLYVPRALLLICNLFLNMFVFVFC
jgi:hypothetical protein